MGKKRFMEINCRFFLVLCYFFESRVYMTMFLSIDKNHRSFYGRQNKPIDPEIQTRQRGGI